MKVEDTEDRGPTRTEELAETSQNLTLNIGVGVAGHCSMEHQKDRVEAIGRQHDAHIVERIPEDRRFFDAQLRGLSVVELGPSPAAEAIERGWMQLCGILGLVPSDRQR